MIRYMKLVIAFFLLFNFYFLIIASAQLKDSTVHSAVANTKMILQMGGYKNGSRALVADFKKLVKVNPVLSLKDEKGIAFPVVSFEFVWRQRSFADDVQTGKPKLTYTAVGQKIKGNKLIEDWVQEINETLSTGDELNFITIIYYDAKKNKTFLAPDLKILIN